MWACLDLDSNGTLDVHEFADWLRGAGGDDDSGGAGGEQQQGRSPQEQDACEGKVQQARLRSLLQTQWMVMRLGLACTQLLGKAFFQWQLHQSSSLHAGSSRVTSHRPPPPPVDVEAEAREAFARFDVDGSGYIDADELDQLAASLAERLDHHSASTEVLHLADFDKDGDGQIDFDEFVVLWNKVINE